MKFFALAGLVAGSVVGAVSSGSALTVEWRDADGVPCDVVCGASYFAVSSGTYKKAARSIAEERIALAGARLAKLLNDSLR
jgi:hypothetical protein